LQVQTIASGSYAAAMPEKPQALLVTSGEDFGRAWQSLIGNDELPAVDFKREAVVLLLAGARPTGGWRVEVAGATVESDALIVEATIHGPSKGSIVTQALTSPYAVIAVPTGNYKKVRWPVR
jgi:hypothetical protein